MNIILLGAPGSGKGTQSELLVSERNFVQLSTGDLFRKHISEKTPLGIEASNFISKGALVPDSITNGMVKDYLINENSENLIFDGFPRTIDQAKALDEMLKKVNKKIDYVIFIHVDDELIFSRLIGRMICNVCKRSYHKTNFPPKVKGKCDYDNSDLIVREDDKEEKIKHRLETYKKENSSIVDFYEANKILYKIDATKLSKEDLKNQILETIKK